MKIGAQAAVLTALILGLVTFVGGGKTVAVAIDGQSQSVSTRAATVADVLKDSQIEVDSLDVVSPGLDAPIADGEAIEIKRNKSVQVNIDGVDRVVHTTGLTVADVLKQLDVDVKSDIAQSASVELAALSTPIDISTPKAVEIKVDGETKKLESTSPTVAEVLNEAKIKLGKDDELNVKPGDAITEGMAVKVTRIETKKVTETEKISHETKTVKDAKALEGTKKTVTKGVDGERTLTYTVTLRDGKEVSKDLDDKTVTTKAVTEEISVGTKEKPKPAKAKTKSEAKSSKVTKTPSSVSGAWAALAKCESGGNWSINTGNGYYGGLQFSASSWRGAGGGKYAALPHQATPAQQIATAENLRKSGGWGHWPACSSKLGLR
ncbi:transglycosylase family protein [Arthrobacter sp. MYb227]|uniref:transglycosylase family protein n=1 Tax=Arthrobacter sp. MYb227 TaxID=1848601 RepID=UPI00280B3203|nr:ubiquitin-like domain-containing protein [Arthrobacter sp. MYb227]